MVIEKQIQLRLMKDKVTVTVKSDENVNEQRTWVYNGGNADFAGEAQIILRHNFQINLDFFNQVSDLFLISLLEKLMFQLLLLFQILVDT